MRLAPVLLAALCLLGTALAARRYNDEVDSAQLTPFRKGHEFVFQYNSQIASGLIAQSEEDASDPQQKSATRIQCQAKIAFSSDRHAQLRLQQCRFGQLNEGQLAKPEQIAPLAIFEPKSMPQQKQRQLELPCQFSYADGVVERVQFHDQDDTWSKNIKRAVLNMIQLNLKRNNAQGLRSGDDQEQQNEEDQEEGQLSKTAKTFTIPEITVEGACQTMYTINPAKDQQQGDSAFNVSKSINFKQCQKIADVAYGYQTEQQQPQCAQCQQYWYKQQQKDAQQSEQQQPGEQHPCAKCDPKEVKDQKLDRATTLRYELVQTGSQEKYALKRTQLVSQYVYKQMKSESGKYGSAMHTVVSSELKLRSVQPNNENAPAMSSSSKDESMMFSNEWDVDAKRFYMFGDDEFGKSGKESPFSDVPKVQQAEQALRKLCQTLTGDKQNGIEQEAGKQLQRLVEMIRMATVPELKKVEQQVLSAGQLNQEEKQKGKQIFCDALAICGTRNCIQYLSEKIQKKEISQTKAAQCLKSLTQLPAPSDEIVKQVERLCKHESVHRQPALQQSCWLTFGALVNELCTHTTQKGAQKSVFGVQSGFDKQELCPLDKKQQYKESILNLYQNADSISQKVMALSALGNAGLDICVGDLEQIIKDPRIERVVRSKAIDALRRLRTQMPHKIQQILLPVFQNNREVPEIRAAAFAILMYTLPEPQVLDQVTYTIAKCSNKQVQAFAYRTLKTMARSQNPTEQQCAKHIKNALKLANVDEQELRNSGKWRIPIYSQDQQEGLFVTLAQLVSPRSAMPAYAHIQLDSHLNDQFSINDIKLSLAQQEAEQWLQNAFSQGMQQPSTRGQRRSSDNDYSSNLRNIYTSLGIKSRRSYSSQMDFSNEDNNDQQQQQRQQPFAMLCIRTGDVDQGFIPLNERNMPELMRQAANGEQQISLARILQNMQGQQQIRGAIATNLCEKQAKIPTSAGVPLRIMSTVPVVATAEGHTQCNSESASLDSPLGVQCSAKVHAMATLVHIQKMECWTPFLVSGVECIHSVELNAPIDAQISASYSQGITLKTKLPRTKTTIVGAHSLPIVYTAEVEPKSGLTREPRHVRAIHQPKLERMQKEVNHVVGEKNLNTPLHIRGHYHWPSQPCNYQQFFQMLQATENVAHVTYQPNDDSPRELVFRAQGNSFQKNTESMSGMQDFYSQQIDSAFDNEELDMDLDNHSSRRQKLQKFLGQYSPKQQYKHSLKLSAQTVGGRKECKAHAEVQANCDSKAQSCQVQLDAQRTPMNGEGQKWDLKATCQLIMPETVQSLEQYSELQQSKQAKLLAQAKAQWGADHKQSISIKVQGESAQNSQWRQQSQQSRQIRKRAAFINKFDVQAQYQNLKPETVNTCQRCLELAKSYYFWNSASQLVQNNNQQQQQGSQSSGQVLCSVVIDPITTKHANISLKTPTQQVRLTQIELPCGQCRPFPLVRQQQQSTHSFNQLISRIQVSGRAECQVDGRQVDTFDDVEYNAPLSTNCYSVLAKDCGSNEPQFVVLMKALQQQSGSNSQKKLKVITPEQSIECQPKQGSERRIQCKVNGQNVQSDDDTDCVEFNNDQKTDVTVHVQGISVRFNGRKAWLKVSSMYKNQQCGLCGHYSDSDDDEWRMNNGQMAQNAMDFHRSYTLKTSVDDEQCSQDQYQQFYENKQNQKMFQQRNQRQQRYSDDQDQDDDDQDDQQDCCQCESGSGCCSCDWQNEQFDGEFDSDEQQDNYYYSEQQQDQQQQQYGSQRNIRQPIQKTRIVEMSHQVCFSKQPVKQCPEGTVPVSRRFSTSDYDSQEDDDDQQQQNNNNNSNDQDCCQCESGSGCCSCDQDQDQDDQQDNQQTKSVEFACMSRNAPETRRLMRQIRQGSGVVNVSQRGSSFTEKVREPKKCQRF